MRFKNLRTLCRTVRYFVYVFVTLKCKLFLVLDPSFGHRE